MPPIQSQTIKGCTVARSTTASSDSSGNDNTDNAMSSRHVERTLGTPRFIALYVVSLSAGAFGALLIDPLAFTVGASGAIFGVFGAAFVLAQLGGHRSIGNQIGAVLAINIFITFAFPILSIGGHIGGLVGGSALAAAYVPMLRARRPEWQTLAVAIIAVAIFAAGALWAASQWPDPLF